MPETIPAVCRYFRKKMKSVSQNSENVNVNIVKYSNKYRILVRIDKIDEE